MNHTKREKRDAFRQEGVNVYNDYVKNGLYIPLKETLVWLKKLATGHYLPPPSPHKKK